MSSFYSEKCVRCGNNSILYDDSNSEKICSKCGYVVSYYTDYDSSKIFSTTSDPELTIISQLDKDAYGKPLSTEVKNSIKRQRKLDEGIKTSSTAQENLNLAKMEMGKLKASLGLSEVVVKSTLSTYKKTIDRKLTRGYSKNGLLAACLYASCKKMDVPRRLEEISNMMNITKKEISRCYKLIMKEIDPWMTPTNPMRFLSRIARNLGSSEKSQRKAASMIEKVLKSGKNVGKDPIGIIAGALYLAGITTGDLKSQKEISEALGVSEGTIRKRCKEIMESINSQTRNTCLG